MDIQRSAPGIRIGEWTFLSAESLLVRGSEQRRLEHRSAEVLQALAERRGAVVSQQQLIDRVWAGRNISPNSVAITIADIRRALGDNARTPRFIETVPKRGYRLADEKAFPEEPPSRLRWAGYAGAAVALAIFAITAATLRPKVRPPAAAVTIANFQNLTGESRYDALAVSVRELAVTDLGKSANLRLVPALDGSGMTLKGKLILWSGHPSVSVSLEDPSKHRIVWAGMAPGPEDALPRQMSTAMAELERKLSSSS